MNRMYKMHFQCLKGSLTMFIFNKYLLCAKMTSNNPNIIFKPKPLMEFAIYMRQYYIYEYRYSYIYIRI